MCTTNVYDKHKNIHVYNKDVVQQRCMTKVYNKGARQMCTTNVYDSVKQIYCTPYERCATNVYDKGVRQTCTTKVYDKDIPFYNQKH